MTAPARPVPFWKRPIYPAVALWFIAPIIGSLSLFLVLGSLTTNGQYPAMWFSNPVILLLMWWIYRRVERHRQFDTRLPGAQPGD